MDQETKRFYDQYWPRNIPIYQETRKYVLDTVSERNIHHALDAGCGPGLCSVALSEIADRVTAVDLSTDSLDTARQEARRHRRHNIEFDHQDLQSCNLPDDSFDLVWCWGVAMMAPDPMKVLENLMRVTKPGGVLYLGVYLKTWLSPVHQGVRLFCRTFLNGPKRKWLVCEFFSTLTRCVCFLRGQEINVRSDNPTIQAQVEDWYYPPYKTFFSVEEIVRVLTLNGFEARVVQDRISRIKSATIFLTKGVKESAPATETARTASAPKTRASAAAFGPGPPG